ncbi:hypothetical protein M5D96_011953 [Drosophila gunungcola]|uniref:Uncharacterized protein n=1 Tax=Drosophila gunungcola TaxID=103775 RepID=A0A9P9YEL6_9MUSC|nr:hypothetical protein M5D96_011953 [Drosophila gunungcola]
MTNQLSAPAVATWDRISSNQIVCMDLNRPLMRGIQQKYRGFGTEVIKYSSRSNVYPLHCLMSTGTEVKVPGRNPFVLFFSPHRSISRNELSYRLIGQQTRRTRCHH